MSTRRPVGRLTPVLCFAGWFAACSGANGQNGAETDLQDRNEAAVRAVRSDDDKIPIRIGGVEIQVEIADEEAERSQGLMHRESLPDDEGMLFVYESSRPLGFWMRNTLIPLDIAYIDEQGRIVDIQQMEPGDETTHWSTSDALYALEMNVGWFAAHDVSIGALLEF